MRVLDDEPDVVLHAAAVEAQSVRQEAELHCAVGAAGEDVIGRAGLDLHDTCAQITEERLTSVFITEGVQEALGGHAPHLDVALGRSADEAALAGVDGQSFDGRVVCLETLALDLQTEVQDADVAPPASAEQQLLFGRQSQNRGARLVTAEAVYQTVCWRDQGIPQTHVPVVCGQACGGDER